MIIWAPYLCDMISQALAILLFWSWWLEGKHLVHTDAQLDVWWVYSHVEIHRFHTGRQEYIELHTALHYTEEHMEGKWYTSHWSFQLEDRTSRWDFLPRIVSGPIRRNCTPKVLSIIIGPWIPKTPPLHVDWTIAVVPRRVKYDGRPSKIHRSIGWEGRQRTSEYNNLAPMRWSANIK